MSEDDPKVIEKDRQKKIQSCLHRINYYENAIADAINEERRKHYEDKLSEHKKKLNDIEAQNDF